MDERWWIIGVIVVLAVGLIASTAWWRDRHVRIEAAYRKGYDEQRAHQQELLENMRAEAKARAAFRGVDFVLMPCVCRAPGQGFAIDCPRCDDTGYVEVVV